MRRTILAVGLACCAQMTQNALAQDFWYVPNGNDHGYTYGFDLGNGVGYGYGVAIGIPLPLSALAASKTADLPQVQISCCEDDATILTADPAIAKTGPVKPKPATGIKAKKVHKIVQKSNSLSSNKMPIKPEHVAETDGQAK